MIYPRLLATYLIFLATLSGCSNEERTPDAEGTRSQSEENTSSANAGEEIRVGGLYASQGPDGSWSVTKVLAVDDVAVHLRTYANSFPELPTDLDPAELTLGGLDDPAGFGIGHFPVDKEGFPSDDHVLIRVVPVEEEELEGYRYYLEAMEGGG